MFSEVFPTRLKKAREDTGFSQTEVAKEIKINRSTLAKYELGQREPDLEKLALLATFYEVSIDWLLGIGNIRDKEEQEKRRAEEKERYTILKDTEKTAKKENRKAN